MALKNTRTPWSYSKGNSLLHRLPAGFKLSFLLLLSLAAFFPGTETLGIIVLLGIAVFLVILSFIAGIGPRGLLRGSSPLLLLVLGVFLLHGIEFSPLGFNPEGSRETVIFCVRIGTAFAAGSLLFAVTTIREIKKSISRLETLLHPEKLRAGLAISLMLGFLPGFFIIWEDINLAWKSRGGKSSLKRFTILIPLALERMMVKAAETAAAMEARGGEKW